MSLAEFNKKTPVDMSIPRTGDINDPQWDKIDLSQSKDPQQQAKLFSKKIVATELADQNAAAGAQAAAADAP